MYNTCLKFESKLILIKRVLAQKYFSTGLSSQSIQLRHIFSFRAVQSIELRIPFSPRNQLRFNRSLDR